MCGPRRWGFGTGTAISGSSTGSRAEFGSDGKQKCRKRFVRRQPSYSPLGRPTMSTKTKNLALLAAMPIAAAAMAMPAAAADPPACGGSPEQSVLWGDYCYTGDQQKAP